MMRAFSNARGDNDMKSWWIDGSTGKLELRDVPVPQPGPAEIVIKLKAAGLNRGEFIHGHGLHKPGSAKPSGFEGAGDFFLDPEVYTGLEEGQGNPLVLLD